MKFLGILSVCLSLGAGAMAQETDNYYPVVITNAAGYGVAVWSDNEAGIISAATYNSGTWSTAYQFNNTSYAFPDPAFLAMDSTGNIVVTWADYNTSTIRAATLPFGGSWTDPVDISTLGDYSYGVVLTMDAAGNSTAVWADVDYGNVQAATLPAGTSTWTSPVSLN